jgi:hypothetical protein
VRTVFAYLDPVTGGALLQVFLGGLAALTLGYQYVRKGLAKLTSRLRGDAPTQDRETTKV